MLRYGNQAYIFKDGKCSRHSSLADISYHRLQVQALAHTSVPNLCVIGLVGLLIIVTSSLKTRRKKADGKSVEMTMVIILKLSAYDESQTTTFQSLLLIQDIRLKTFNSPVHYFSNQPKLKVLLM